MVAPGAVHLFLGTASTALEANVPLWPSRNHLGGLSVRFTAIIHVSDAHLFSSATLSLLSKTTVLV
jgi:hypothetical protein